jgi:hypothetical protein
MAHQPLIHHTLCQSYGYALSLPDIPLKNKMLEAVRSECYANLYAWINWIHDLPNGHSVREDWLNYTNTYFS